MKTSIVRVLSGTALLLLIPLFGNLFVEGWNWSPFDFLIMGTLLFLVGMTIDFAARKIAGPTYKALTIIGIVLMFLAIWTELAVGAVSQLVDAVF